MQIYRVSGRWTSFVGGFFGLAFGTALTLFGIKVWDNVLGALLLVFMGVSTGYMAWTYGVRGPYEIGVTADGTVVFVRPLGRTRIAAWEIRVIEGFIHRDYDGDPIWYMAVHHARGRVKMGYFEGATDFLALVQTHNPAVTITGLWPMPMPPRPTPPLTQQ
jgi:hypothetical protein